jgi:hypothetical protein
MNQEQNTSLVTLNVGRKLQRPGKFTPAKRKQFLEHYAKTGNFSQSALQVGLSRDAIYKYLESDEDFKKSFQYVEDHITDTIEQISLQVAIQPTRESFNDRKLQLQARRPEKYNPKQEIDIKHQITLKNADQVASQILSENSLQSAISADYEIIEDG